MAAIKHALQRDIFTPNQERLLGVVHVGKTGGKKKKSSFLCASGIPCISFLLCTFIDFLNHIYISDYWKAGGGFYLQNKATRKGGNIQKAEDMAAEGT